MTMTVRDLKSLLEGVDEDAEVRIAHQPHWPFEYSIRQVVAVGTNDEDIEEIEDHLGSGELTAEEKEEARSEMDRLAQNNVQIVYIGEGSQIGYLPGAACEALGWR